MEVLNKPSLSNMQLELLKLYSTDILDSDLKEVKKLLAKFFLDKARNGASKIWIDKEYSDEKIDNLSQCNESCFRYKCHY